MPRKQMVKHELPNREFLLSILSYDAVTGTLTWRVRPPSHFKTESAYKRWNTLIAGTIAGSKQEKGLRVGIGGVGYMANRICWVMAGNELPPSDHHIDHRDRDQFNNAEVNLRIASGAQNTMNSKVRSDNRCGLKCVNKVSDKWGARIVVNGRRVSLGKFHTKGLAAVAYAKAALQHYGQFARFT